MKALDEIEARADAIIKDEKLIDKLITCQSCKGVYGQTPESCCTDCMNTGIANDPYAYLFDQTYALTRNEIPKLCRALRCAIEGGRISEIQQILEGGGDES